MTRSDSVSAPDRKAGFHVRRGVSGDPNKPVPCTGLVGGCRVVRGPRAPRAHPSGGAVLWCPVGCRRFPQVPGVAKCLHLERPLQAASVCHCLCPHWPLAAGQNPAGGTLSGTSGRREGRGAWQHKFRLLSELPCRSFTSQTLQPNKQYCE